MRGMLSKPAQQVVKTPPQHTIVAIEGRLGLQPMSNEPVEHAEHAVNMGLQKFKIRLTRTDDHTQSASVLIRKMYSWRGYTTSATPVEHTANKICLSVFSKDQIIGTLTLGHDVPGGLAADAMYKPEVDVLRASGRVLCEMTKLAVDQCVRSRKVLASLFHIAYIHARHLHGCTDILIEVNPRHVGFYERMLGFRQVGEERHCPRVNAPAVLLGLETDYVEIQIRKFGGLMETANGEKSLYPYFFSAADEAGIAQRLLENRHS